MAEASKHNLHSCLAASRRSALSSSESQTFRVEYICERILARAESALADVETRNS